MPFPGRASYDHPENAMPWSDMEAIQRVANKRNEVITFRSTGPWSKRWIEAGFPTKGFHVKGKSSDWGPMAGFVPWEGKFSKVGHNPAAVAKGNKFNHDGVEEGYAKRIPLILTGPQLSTQLTIPAGRVPRLAIIGMMPVGEGPDKLLYALRSGDQQMIPFRAVQTATGDYRIDAFADNAPLDEETLEAFPRAPLEVMASTEAGSDKPMTGDYDLFNICPSFGSYGSQLRADVTFQGTTFGANKAESVTFFAGQGMDQVMDTRLYAGGGGSIGGTAASKHVDYSHRREQYLARLASMGPGSARDDFAKQLQDLGIVNHLGEAVPETPWEEHHDMGNLTPRILQCILDLNVAMGSGQMGLLRRVHHNAESHRNRLHGGLKREELEAGEGLPITIFQPDTMGRQRPIAATGYDTIDTIETWDEFKTYAVRLKAAGYYVPKSWTWGT